MLTGAVEVYANHAVLIVGSTGWPELDWGDGPADTDGRHVAVKTRGQVGHTRVSFWSGSMPMLGALVFDGDLTLEDYRICVGDIEGLRRWTQRISHTGPQRVIVRVDDPGYASHVYVGLDIAADAQVRPLPNTGPVLFDVLTSDRDGMHLANQRGLALDGHDSPHKRLAAAIILLSDRSLIETRQNGYEADLIAEWLRWLSTDLGHAGAMALGEQLRQLVIAARTANPAGDRTVPLADAARIAGTILKAVIREA
ncbi:hypothetical protein OHA72_22625 [Dactylosporangium sp. NBC_01737]|uniref:hypothetical protein n=1 Tax=Dactylosporangium sp. NBC_01737 TaxID=2975959 RepID=UPI002E120A0B|nr:hypothetical protein OHA72_22625 [Dactylosporangium sp. NBC_01737]